MSSRIEKIRLACEKLNNSLNVVSEPMQTVEYSSDLSQVAAVAGMSSLVANGIFLF